MDFFKTIIESFYSIVRVFRIADLIDIILISYLMYKGIKLVRETRAQQLVKGILLLAISNLIATQFGLLTMSFILEKVFEIGIIALVILFQPELRRALEKVGRAKVPDFSLFSTDSPDRKANVWGKVI
ncbi:MAG: TIGR00159 family protein, partial [Oscillospiraceae bacterium]